MFGSECATRFEFHDDFSEGEEVGDVEFGERLAAK